MSLTLSSSSLSPLHLSLGTPSLICSQLKTNQLDQSLINLCRPMCSYPSTPTWYYTQLTILQTGFTLSGKSHKKEALKMAGNIDLINWISLSSNRVNLHPYSLHKTTNVELHALVQTPRYDANQLDRFVLTRVPHPCTS